MTTITRHPTGQDLMCLVCLKPAQDIDHVVNRGMGGSKERDVPENKVPLCRECHTAKTNGVLETEIFPVADGRTNYHWRRKGAGASWISVPVEVSPRYKCLVLSAAAEGGRDSNDSVELSIPETESSAAAPSAGIGGEAATPPQVSPSSPSRTKEESDAKQIMGQGDGRESAGDGVNHGARDLDSHSGNDRGARPDSGSDSPDRLTSLAHEQRPLDDCCQRLMLLSYQFDRLESATDEWKWQVGECMNDLERIVGAEEVNGYLRGFRKEKTLMQYAWVAAKVTRVIGLSWSHHRAVAALPPSEQQQRLEEAKAAGTPAEGLRLALQEPRERHSCPSCGAEHQVKGGAMES